MKRHVILLFAAALCFGTFAWAQAPTEFKGHTALVSSVAINKQGILASGSFDKSVKLWDVSTGKPLQTLNHGAPVTTIAFSPDGSVLASGGNDNLIKLWNPMDGKTIKEFKGHGGPVQSIAYSSDGGLLVSGGQDKSVRLWDTKEGKELKNLGSHKETVYSVAVSPNGQYAASASYDAAIKIWDVKGQKELKQFMPAPIKLVYLEVKKPDVKEEKKEEKDKKKEEKKDAKKKDDKKGKKEEPKEIRDNVTGVAFTPDSKFLMSVGYDKMLRVWDFTDGKEIKELGPLPHWINGLAVSPDGKNVAVAGYGGSLRVWEIGTWKQVASGQLPPKSIVYSVTFTPDGKALVTGHENPNYLVKVTPLSALKEAPPKEAPPKEAPKKQ
jgi:WD40 repeat protein